MSALLFGSLAAVANAGQALISKELTLRAPARQLIGVLYAGNAVVLLYRISDVPHAADPAPTTAAALDDLLSPAAAEPLPSG